MDNSFYWSQEDLCLLWLGVGAGFQARAIGLPIHRSQTAVLKATKRYKIADLPKPYDARRLWNELVTSLQKPEFPDLCEIVLNSHDISFPHHDYAERIIQQKKRNAISAQLQRHPLETKEEWGRWSDVVKCLGRAGVCVQKNVRHYNLGELLLNNQPSTRKQALMLVNRMRYELSLPPLLVAGITE